MDPNLYASEEWIKAHAEARANLTFEGEGYPTEDDFAQAEREVLDMLADGATYSDDNGWEW